MDSFTSINLESFTEFESIAQQLTQAASSTALASSIEESQLPVDFEVRSPGGTFYCVIA